jgi:2-hydroxycyclohexanecarboxyl-CoA dehydrogenase
MFSTMARYVRARSPFSVDGRVALVTGARESAPYGVRCNAVAPGPIDTPLLNESAVEAGSLGIRMKRGMIDATLLKRGGRPDEVAAAIAFLVSHDSSFVAGHTLAVSGGPSLQ